MFIGKLLFQRRFSKMIGVVYWRIESVVERLELTHYVSQQFGWTQAWYRYQPTLGSVVDLNSLLEGGNNINIGRELRERNDQGQWFGRIKRGARR